MKHSEIEELLEAYSLDILAESEQDTVQKHLQTGCNSCLQKVKEYSEIAGLAALDVKPMVPPDHVSRELLAKIDSEAESRTISSENLSGYGVVLHDDGVWEPLFRGIDVRILGRDANSGYTTALVRMQPGSRLPAHQHIGDEESFVVAGSCSNAGQDFQAGDYWRAKDGSSHETTESAEGCTLLVRYHRIEFSADN